MHELTPRKILIQATVCLGIVVSLYVFKQVAINARAKTISSHRITTRMVPMLVANLKPGMVVTTHDLGQGPWPSNEIMGDVLLGPQVIVGRVVKKEIKAAYPIHASSLYRLGEYSKEYFGVP